MAGSSCASPLARHGSACGLFPYSSGNRIIPITARSPISRNALQIITAYRAGNDRLHSGIGFQRITAFSSSFCSPRYTPGTTPRKSRTGPLTESPLSMLNILFASPGASAKSRRSPVASNITIVFGQRGTENVRSSSPNSARKIVPSARDRGRKKRPASTPVPPTRKMANTLRRSLTKATLPATSMFGGENIQVRNSEWSSLPKTLWNIGRLSQFTYSTVNTIAQSAAPTTTTLPKHRRKPLTPFAVSIIIGWFHLPKEWDWVSLLASSLPLSEHGSHSRQPE